ncbi:hypothetical protein [Stieleria neptunia]|uniref:hypothetical protein n=1 Tax=Stieleria neptunia TaxID=2527979 RepID=UPI0018D1F88D|nr:hypothetical protein [Stieleria neptunia]
MRVVKEEVLAGGRWQKNGGQKNGRGREETRKWVTGKCGEAGGRLLKTQNSKLKTQNSKLKTQNSKLKTQNSKLKTQNSKLKTQNSKLKT